MAGWQRLPELPDLRRADIVALDSETKDGGLLTDRGSSAPWGDGYLCGISVAWRTEGNIRAHYLPLRHPDSPNFDLEQVRHWLHDLFASGVRIVTQNGIYDYGWLRTEMGLQMPASEHLEEIGALATMVDENRYKYSLDALCAWRELPGKDEALLLEGCKALGLISNKRKKFRPQAYLWQLPARFVGPYAEADAANTLALFESLNPILDQEGTRNAYRLEVDLLPMVLEMRRRGVRIDVPAAERAHELLLRKRDTTLAELSEKLATNVGMAEIGRTAWLVPTFEQQKIKYEYTDKGNPSFTAGNLGWMPRNPHWLPQLIVKADRYNNAAVNVLENYILGHVINGRVYSEIHPHRSDEGGTRSLRFSYSNPPLQLMPVRDEELGPLIRGVFLPEEGEFWAKPDVSQQEFRFIVHYAAQLSLPRAAEAVARYREDSNTDFHNLVVQWTSLERSNAKGTNFAKAFGAGVRKLAAMIRVSEPEARAIMATYDRELPFVLQLAKICEKAAKQEGYLTLYDGARRHWSNWEAGGITWTKGMGPCPREEAERRIKDPEHPWYRRWIRRADTRKALNALIQGSAARHTKLWMRMCWREGIIPLLQMHDALECSVSSREQAEHIAQLGCEAVALEVPMLVDLKFGRSWGDAKHTWEELNAPVSARPAPAKTTITSGGIPFMITVAQKTRLAELGFSGSEIHELTPVRAQEILSSDDQGSDPPPPWEETPPGTVTPTIYPPPPSRSSPPNDGSYAAGERPWGRIVTEYIYRFANGEPYGLVTRTSAKQFPQSHWEHGKWMEGAPKGPKLPYRLPELLAAPNSEPVWPCEGEKDADSVAALGLVATTNPGGAGKWDAELGPWFIGKQLAYILGDNDVAGQAHARQVAGALQDIVANIHIVSFPDVPEHGDVSDWLAAGHTKEDLIARAKASPQYEPIATLFDPWADYSAPEFPLDTLPPTVRNFVHGQSTVTGADVSAVAMATLGSLSGAIDHRFSLKIMRHGNWWAHPRLWILLVGASSSAKTPIFNAVTKPLEEYQHELLWRHAALMKEFKESGEKDADPPPAPSRLVAWDSTVEAMGELVAGSPRGVLMKCDEVVGWIGGMEKYTHHRGPNPDRAFWLKAYDGGRYIVDRIKRGTIVIENLSVSVLGGIQTSRIAGLLEGLSTDGMLQRLLPVLMQPSKPTQDIPNDDALYDILVRQLLALEPARLFMTDAARDRMTELRKYLHEFAQAAEGTASGFPAFILKVANAAGSLAIILHLAANPRNTTEPIEDSTIEAVGRIVHEFILPHAYGFYRIGPYEGDQLQRLASWILTSGKTRIIASEFSKSVWGLRGLPVKELNDRISPFVAGGWLEPESKVGFSNIAWNVRPGVLTQFEERRKTEEARKQTLGKRMKARWATDAKHDHTEEEPDATAEPTLSSCVRCGREFEATRADAQYCSSGCRQKAYRQRVSCDR